MYCCCETGHFAVHESDGFDIGHCHERKKSRIFGDWLCLGLSLGLGLLVEWREGESTQRAALSRWIYIYSYTLELIAICVVGTVLNNSVTSCRVDSCLVV